MGTAVHGYLEAHYLGKSEQECEAEFIKLYPEQLDSEDKSKTQANGLTLLKGYLDHYRLEDKKWRILGVEEKGEIELAPGIKYLVKIDLIAENTEHGGVYIWDHKTTGKAFTPYYWAQFEPNSQLTGYCAYVQSKYGECSGAYINAIRFGHRERKYKDQPAGFYYEFQRQMFNRNQRQMDSWKLDVLQWVQKFTTSRSDNSWPKNMGQCSFCSYRPVCIAEWNPEDEADRECIEIMYEKCDPFKYLKSETEGGDDADRG